MSIYDRYKKDPDGFRRLVELLETTPMKRRQELIDRGMKEDPSYTKAALDHIITFQDIVGLPEMELTEVIAAMKPKNVAFCIVKEENAQVKERFLACVQKTRVIEVHSYLDMTPAATEIGQAKKEAIAAARKLEQSGILNLKRIPKNINAKELAKEKKGGVRKDENMPDPFADGKDLFGDGLFGADAGEAAADAAAGDPFSQEIGKKKAG